MVWFQQPWFDSEAFANPWWHALLDDDDFSGSYITFGFGQSAGKVLLLGLAPASEPVEQGSYVTLGTAQSASLFLRLGMGVGEAPPEPPEVTPLPSGGFLLRLPLRDRNRGRILRDDREVIDFLATVLQSGLLH